MTDGNNDIFYLTGLIIDETGHDDEIDVSYEGGKMTYSGRMRTGYLHLDSLPVRNLTPDVNRGLTLVEAVAGEVFVGKPTFLVHVCDLVTRQVVGQPYDELLTE
jgi:hypothetical protein